MYSRKIPEIRNPSHTLVYPESYLSIAHTSNSVESEDDYINLVSPRCDQSTDLLVTDDGIPSWKELNRLMSPEGRSLRTFDQVHVAR